jgi:hypothetical protein
MWGNNKGCGGADKFSSRGVDIEYSDSHSIPQIDQSTHVAPYGIETLS